MNQNNLDYNRIYGDCRKVYNNYSLSTYKFAKLYPDYDFRKIITYLASVAHMELVRNDYNRIIPALEAMDSPSVRHLIQLAKDGKLDILTKLLNIVFRGG